MDIQVVFEKELDDGLYNTSFVIRSGINCEFDFTADGVTHWTNLLDAIKNNKNYTLKLLDSNGQIYIKSCKDYVTFATSKSGSYNYGAIKITIPSVNCIQAITDAAEHFKIFGV